MSKQTLSKSTFIRGLQCEKSLYLYKHHYQLKDTPSEQLQAVFSQGTAVGLLAQDLFPGGVDASPEDYFKMIESVSKTKMFIDAGETIIYEATFKYNGVMAALDILVKDKEGWKAYEVKSSTHVSDTYIYDAAIQYYTIVNSGIALKDISIIYINNQYTRNGALDLNDLFNIESVYDRVQKVLPDIPNKVAAFKDVIAQGTIPNIDIGMHCSTPYDCDFKGYCWQDIPDYSIFNISRLNARKKFALYNEGIVTFDQLNLETAPLNDNQMMQVKSELEGRTFIDKENINRFIKNLNYPLYYLDFETIGSAVPIYDNTRPYQQLVFQYSLHVQESPDSCISHFEYLAKASPTIDPRANFVNQLIKDCGTSGDILVYNIGFERGRLNELRELYPQYSKALTHIISRLKDLMLPFQQKWYYTPAMKGSYSIKYVLPALVPELSYKDLEIQNGGTASSIFVQMVQGSLDKNIAQTRQNLLKYCEMDTWAMVKILEKLQDIFSVNNEPFL
jgi:uncharacterized protein DUF2779